MQRSTKDAWLTGTGDLAEAVVEDVPVKGQSVKVRGLPAAFANDAQSRALEMRTLARGEGRGDQVARVNTRVLEILQFQHGVIDPEFTFEEAEQIAERFGPAWRKVIEKIDELSGIDKAAIEQAEAMFPSGAGSAGREDVGDGASAGSR
jgi:hypothetical protein